MENTNENKPIKIARPKPAPGNLPETFDQSDFSEASIEVLEHFGIEAPTLLNDFAISLEDALIELMKRHQLLKTQYQELKDKQK